ncbi:MAG: 16S rRNA (cytosine(1402)-N(4))-methyltransferase RsmH [Bacteriovoracaceae bacterium]|nr:16S rRNA (cytosine(1402)-N(4))-methyltransferase RsmH [Bacteriovoracaceae bacterium]
MSKIARGIGLSLTRSVSYDESSPMNRKDLPASAAEYLPHCPIMPEEIYGFLRDPVVAEQLAAGIFVDLTLGFGGHAKILLDLNDKFKLWAFDQDEEAIRHAQQSLLPQFGDRLKLFAENFAQAPQHLPLNSCAHILLDLGVSTHQLLAAERGFSWNQEGPLDMRMQRGGNLPTAADLVNNLPENELADLIFQYGEERLAKKIAAAIVAARQGAPIQTTKDLENIIFHTYPPQWRHGRTHPATKTFQALRLKVNQELEVLTQTLPALAPCLMVGGRISVISFHSLEDRIVKLCFRELAKGNKSDDGPSNSPGYALVTKKPLTPTEQELAANHRARSAKLRIITRVR